MRLFDKMNLQQFHIILLGGAFMLKFLDFNFVMLVTVGYIEKS
jgi:hypothetical protein